MAEKRNIQYINKNFDDFRSALIDYTKNYFPDTYNDFSNSSPGMLFIEMASYVGDILSFYQDTQLQETFLTHAKDPKNLFNLAYMMGYKPKVSVVSEAEITLTQTVDADVNDLPDWSQAAIVREGSTLESTDSSQTKFLLKETVDFTVSSSYDPTNVVIAALDSSNNPTSFTLTKKAKAVSAEVATTTFTIGPAERFKTITLSDENIIGIDSITDSDGVEWTEVPFLGQDIVYNSASNAGSDANVVPYEFTLKKVPNRFVTRFRADGSLTIQFGAGTLNSDDSEFLPDPTLVGNATDNGVSKLDDAFDPSNFLYGSSYGNVPANVTLTVNYLKGGGVSANVPANSITKAGTIVGTNTTGVSYNNTKPASGGRDGDTVEELRENSLRAFNEQNRAVTLQDYAVRAAALPAKYGSTAKVFATQESISATNKDSVLDNNPLAISLYVLAYDNEGKLTTATSTLKENLKNYIHHYKILSDSIKIRDAFIVNIGVRYEILTRPGYSGRDVLLQCNIALQDYFKTSKRSINQPINLAELYTLLDKIPGTQTVQKIEITNKQGGNYSQYAYDVKGATRDEIVYPSYDPCIFEVKYPNTDIVGRVIK